MNQSFSFVIHLTLTFYTAGIFSGWSSWRSLQWMGSPTYCQQGRPQIFCKWLYGGVTLRSCTHINSNRHTIPEYHITKCMKYKYCGAVYSTSHSLCISLQSNTANLDLENLLCSENMLSRIILFSIETIEHLLWL